MAQKLVLAYDLGGTKVAVGVVNQRGRILEQIRQPVRIESGKAAVLNQLIQLGKNYLKAYPSIKRAGVASAGPLDPYRGVLLNPTNFFTAGESWEQVPLTSQLRRKLKIPVFLENDAAASILAEHWIGIGKKFQNAMIITLGTGVGIGTICNGKLVRSGQYLHPEASHISLRAGDPEAPCGCGNFGCIEAYLSGRAFERRFQTRSGQGDLTCEKIADQARQGNAQAKLAFEQYAQDLAIALHSFAVLYGPQLVVFTGSFAAAADLFLGQAQAHLKILLKKKRAGKDLLPKLVLSGLNNNAGLIGGAYVAFHR